MVGSADEKQIPISECMMTDAKICEIDEGTRGSSDW
jgi:hypothetical protein